MNTTWAMIRKNYVMHIVMAVMSVIVSFVGNVWLGCALGMAIYVIYMVMQFTDGADRGERACTLTATIDKIQSEGRQPDDRMLKQKYNRKGALIAFGASALPLLLLAIVNLVLSNPDAVNESILGIITRVVYLPIAWLTRLFSTSVGVDYTGTFDAAAGAFQNISHAGVDFAGVINTVAGIGEYSFAYDVHYLTWMRIAYIPFSVLPALAMFIGYLQGPKFREKKLKEIQKGTRKKRKKLKVYNKTRQPRQIKPEV